MARRGFVISGNAVAAFALLLLVPAAAFAQTAIAGAVRDTTGAVLPGVTVEAASPALIEKVRTVTTDGQGLYKIADLRPGVYTEQLQHRGDLRRHLDGRRDDQRHSQRGR